MEPELRPKFIKRPKPVIEAIEGSDVVLNCALNRKFDSERWLRTIKVKPQQIPNNNNNNNQPAATMVLEDIVDLFDNDIKQNYNLDPRYTFVGDVRSFDYSIAIKRIQLADAGTYSCEAVPEDMHDDNVDYYRVSTNLTVLPAPPPQQQHTGATTTIVHHHHNHHQQQADANLAVGSQLDNNNLELALEPLGNANNHKQMRNGTHNNSADRGLRDISPSWIRLSTSSGFISPSMQPSTSYLGRHHQPLGGGGGSSSSPLGLGNSVSTSASLVATWPWLLLCLAFLLMLANIYLIYALIKRHTGARSSTSGDSHEGLANSRQGQ